MISLNILLVFFTIVKLNYAFWDFNFDLSDINLKKTLDGARKDCPVATNECPPEVTYWFYTQENRDGVQLNPDDIENAGFLNDKQFKILIHGYWNDHTSPMVTSLKDAYLDHGEYNVIAVDWGHFAKAGCYPEARTSINPVAGCVTDFLRRAVGEGGYGRIHLLGHSLGAHVSARVSSHFDDPRISRLTKFDPAMPLFVADQIEVGKADFRDIYHSNCEVLGQRTPQGDVDVYLNNDMFQPGCGCDLSCSHMRSVQYFAESISRGMKGFQCGFWDEFLNGGCPQPTPESLAELGDNANTDLRGHFKVFGKREPPFLYSEEDYLNSDTFSRFKDEAKGECVKEQINDLGDKIKDFLSTNQVTEYFKKIM